MRIYTSQGDLKFSTFNFPDGQPHFKLEGGFGFDTDLVVIETAIKSPADLFMVLLAVDVLDKQKFARINLDVRYLMGARMDRPIGLDQPSTLQTVSQLVNFCGFNRVRILDVHSEIALKTIHDSENVLPVKVVDNVLACAFWGRKASIVTPDKGATERVKSIVSPVWVGGTRIQCFKVRDMETGKLSGFEIENPKDVSDHAIIIDDICDGGGTFTGLATELRKAGAKKVSLFVTHGIFSKGLPLEGIDHIYTTDSYFDVSTSQFNWHAVNDKHVTVFPISMKDL